jgi:hypothetical protein
MRIKHATKVGLNLCVATLACLVFRQSLLNSRNLLKTTYITKLNQSK